MNKPTYIYVLTNKCFNKANLVKIGYTNDLEERLKSLSNTSVYEDFEVYATYEVDESVTKPDLLLHKIIDSLNPNSRLNSKKEFYEMYPWEVYELLLNIAKLTNTVDKLKRNGKDNYGDDLCYLADYTEESLFGDIGTDVRELYDSLLETINSLGEEFTIVPTKLYVAIKNKKNNNVLLLWPKREAIEIVLWSRRGKFINPDNIAYDIYNRLWTAHHYAVKFNQQSNIEQIKFLIKQAFDLAK